jgi:hypothetical protein
VPFRKHRQVVLASETASLEASSKPYQQLHKIDGGTNARIVDVDSCPGNADAHGVGG